MNYTERQLLLHMVEGTAQYETRLDYDVRSDTQPVYIGRAVNNTDVANSGWTIEKFTYDGANRPIRKQVLAGAWNDRATLGW